LNTSTHWNIEGGYVALDSDTGILSCLFIPPCASYILHSMGLNATQMDGRKVMLATDFTQSVTGLPLKIQEFHHVFDDSTPAPIPNGQPAPALPPAMADTTKPVVTLTVPPLPFKQLAPAPVTATFTLSTTFPMHWILTLIHEAPSPGHVNLTNGIPGMADVTPSGGDWNTPALTVNVTLQIPFLNTFAPGKHDLYLTGISQRGLSAFDSGTFVVVP